MKKLLSLAFVLGILISVFCCGCVATNEKNYTFELDIYRGKELANYTKYKVYIKGSKWKQEEFIGNSDKPYLISLFDGKNYYIKNDTGAPVKDTTYSKEELLTKHEAFPLINWDVNSVNIFSFFKTEATKVGQGKTKYGHNCTLYKYGPWTDCNQNNVCSTNTRKVCVNDDNIAMSIEMHTKPTNSHTSKFKLNVVNMNTDTLENKIFKVSSL